MWKSGTEGDDFEMIRMNQRFCRAVSSIRGHGFSDTESNREEVDARIPSIRAIRD
jgi:hypothetical protein